MKRKNILIHCRSAAHDESDVRVRYSQLACIQLLQYISSKHDGTQRGKYEDCEIELLKGKTLKTLASGMIKTTRIRPKIHGLETKRSMQQGH